MIDSLWKDRYYAQAYKLAREGLKDAQIADSLGVSMEVFREWKKERSELQVVIRNGRAEYANDTRYTGGGKLSVKEQRFVDEFMVDLNVTQAAIRAGYAKKSAGVQGSAILSRPKVIEALQRKIRQRSELTDIDTNRILQEFACIAFSNIQNVFDDKGCLKDIHDLDEATARAIKKIKVTSHEDKQGEVTTTAEIDLWDKIAGGKVLAQHYGLIDINDRPTGVHQHQHVHLESGENPYEGADPKLILKAKSALAKLKKSIENPVTLD